MVVAYCSRTLIQAILLEITISPLIMQQFLFKQHLTILLFKEEIIENRLRNVQSINGLITIQLSKGCL